MLAELNLYAVARQKPDPIPHRRSRAMRQNLRLVIQFEPVQQARQLFQHDRRYRHGRVKTHGPFAVTATQCSKCAE